MITYYITECEKCNLIQSNSTSDLSKAVAICKSCGKKTKVKHTHILKKSSNPNFITKVCQEIKKEKHFLFD